MIHLFPFRPLGSRPVVALSLALCVACAAGWMRSYWVGDEVGRLWQQDDAELRRLRGLSLAHGRGVFRIWIVRIEQRQPATITCRDEWVYSPHASPQLIVDSAQQVLGFAGFGYAWQTGHDYWLETYSRTSGVILPYWVAMFFLLPLAWCSVVGFLRRRRGKRWRAAGCCPQCGYDRRASPECCPECGAVP
jgi:hypothetical protein